MVAFIGSELERAVACGERAVAAGTEAGLEEYVVAGRMLVAGVELRERRPRCPRPGRGPGRDGADDGWDETAWRGYIMLTVHDMERGELRSLQRVIEETLAHTTERDLRNATLWHLSLRAMLHAYAGRWSAAREDAEEVLPAARCDGSVWPHLALAIAAQRVGDQDASPRPRARLAARGLPRRARPLPARSSPRWPSRCGSPATPDPGSPTTPSTTWPSSPRPTRPWPAATSPSGCAVSAWPSTLPPTCRSRTAAQLEGRYAEAAAWWQRAGQPVRRGDGLRRLARSRDRVRGGPAGPARRHRHRGPAAARAASRRTGQRPQPAGRLHAREPGRADQPAARGGASAWREA